MISSLLNKRSVISTTIIILKTILTIITFQITIVQCLNINVHNNKSWHWHGDASPIDVALRLYFEPLSYDYIADCPISASREYQMLVLSSISKILSFSSYWVVK